VLPAFWTEAVADEAIPASIADRRSPPPVTSADQVLNVEDFEALAQRALPPAHFGYLATGADGDRTLARNHDAFAHYEIRAHRFVDVSRIDSTRAVWGQIWASPIYLSAVSGMRAFHPEAELAVARAARSRTMPLMMSTGASTPLEPVQEALGGPVWQQLYATDDWSVTEAIVRRAEAAGATAIALTVDSRGPRNNETLKRAMLVDSRRCTDCHPGNSHDLWRRAPMFSGVDVSRVTALSPPDLSPPFIDRLRRLVNGRLIVKGVVTGEDATVALNHGADAVVVSNHGGRNEETGRATIDCLAEVVAAVGGRTPVFIDGGIRRGTDVFKALALGATAVGIGRPYAWGLAAFGEPGVAAVIDILRRELGTIMRQAGTPTLAAISPANVVRTSGA
jgi:(S)-2-hydroxy-acid oxidase